MSARPTSQEIAEARKNVAALLERMRWHGGSKDIEVLLAATEPPTDEEIHQLATCDVDHHEDSYVSGFEDAVRHFLGGPQ